MKRKICGLLLMLICAGALPACADSYPSHYSAEAIEARVVDAKTKKPLEGVIVTANWQLFHSTVGGRVPDGQLMVMETVTDKDGRFAFPAWGPMKVPKYKPQKGDVWIAYIPFLVPDGYLDNYDPQLLLFKSGYEYQRLANEVTSSTNMASVRRSEWNGRTIEMKLFKGTTKEYVGHFHDLNTDIEQIIVRNPEDCNWKKLSEMLLAIDRERKLLEQQGADPQTLDSVYRALITYQNDWYTKNGGEDCGSPKEFFQRYQP